MEASPLVTREEVTGVLFVTVDISENVDRIVQLLEDDDDGEAEDSASIWERHNANRDRLRERLRCRIAADERIRSAERQIRAAEPER